MSNLFLILFSSVCLLIGYIVYEFYWTQRAINKFANKLSGPKPIFLLGSALPFLMCKKQDALKFLRELVAPFSSPVRLWFGSRLFVYLKSAEHLQTVMQSKITAKSYMYKFFEPFLGQGLLTVSGEAHLKARREYQAFFTQRMLDAYSHFFGKYAVKFVEEIKCRENGEKFNVISCFNNSSFESFMDILLEKEEFDSAEFKDAKTLIRKGYDSIFDRLVSPWLHRDFVYKQTKAYKEQIIFVKHLKSVLEKVLKPEMLRVAEKMENLEVNENCTKRAPSITELLIEMRGGNSNSFLQETDLDHIVTLIAANQDTQSSAMAFTCMMLGMFPKAQDKIYAELMEVLDGRKVVDFRDASKLKYLEMCIKEALRLFPPIPFTVRDTIEDFELEADLVIPENVSVILSIFDVHRDPKHWEKPNDYYPEHHTPESVANRHPYAFVPFSRGSRKCIAQNYAYTNMKIMLATMLLNYVIGTDEKFEDIKLMADISIRPINGYFIKIKKRVA